MPERALGPLPAPTVAARAHARRQPAVTVAPVPTPRLARLATTTLPSGLEVREARTPLERLRGLAGLESIEPDEALLLRRCRSIHTLGMRFALDLIWLDTDDHVVSIDHDVQPNRVRSCRHARHVIEVRAGEAGKSTYQ